MEGTIFRLGDVVRIDSGISMPDQAMVWLLNLDMIEQQTGRLLDRLMVPREQIGSSTIGFDADCVLYSKLRPNLNKVLLPDRPGVATSEILPLRVIAKTMSKEYLCWFLRSPAFVTYAQSRTAGAKMPRLGSKALLDARIPVPPLSRQREIVAQLEGLQKIFQLSNSELSRLRQLAKSRFVEMFGDVVLNDKGWPIKTLPEIGENLDGKRIPITSGSRKPGPYPYYGASGIVDHVEGYIFDEDILLISEDGANLLMRSTPIAFSATGKVWVNNHAHVMRFSDLATQKYIECFVNAISIENYVTGTAQPKLNQAKLNSIPIPFPPVMLQREYAAFIQQLDKSEFAIRKRLEKARLLYHAKLQEFFG